jgi:threonine/homoserine/homoserine lactone efflux protein
MGIELMAIGFIAALTPGPDIFLTIQTTLNRSLKAGLGVLSGIMTGNAIIIGILFFGFAQLGENPYFQLTVSLFGGLYLLYIAKEIFIHRKDSVSSKDIKARNLYLKGLYVNLSNPKAIIFFGAILAPFINQNTIALDLLSLFVGIISAFLFAIIVSDIFRKNLLSPKVSLFINTFSSFLFFAFSIELLRHAAIKIQSML